MSRARLLGLVAVLCAAAGYAAAPATAAQPPYGPGTDYPEKLTTEHFQIHYTGALLDVDRILHQDAGDLAANAERAYDLFVKTWGYPAPKDDGDGRVDIFVQKQGTGAPLVAGTFDTAPPTTMWFSLDPTKVLDRHTAAWIAMAAIEAGIWVPFDKWVIYATAEWAAFAADGYASLAGTLPAPDMALDCEGSACGNTSYEIQGDSRWSFFQYLNERFGTLFVKSIFDAGKASGDVTKTSRDLLITALAAKNVTLGSVLNDFSAAHVAGAYTVEGLKGGAPKTYSTIPLGLVTATFPAQKIDVNHLAARYVKLQRDPSNTGNCYSATLSVTVALPKDSASKPTLFASSLGSSAMPLTIKGSTASISVPWSTCPGGGDAYLALPNPSLTADAQDFTVGVSLAVSSVSLTPPSAPPVPAYVGPVTAAPTVDAAPSILVHGAELVRVPAATRTVRLLVFSSGAGQLRAKVGDLDLGVVTLRAGNNDVRFVLPAATVKGLRRVKSVLETQDAVLSLTSLSPQGAAGETVTRKLVVVEPKKKKR